VLVYILQQLQLKAYSASTIRTYRTEFLQLLKLLKSKPVNELTVGDIKKYMVYAMQAGIIKPGSVHSLRHSFATHLIDKDTDVTMIQRLLGHNDLKTTLRYLHTSNKDLLKIISPLDDLKLT